MDNNIKQRLTQSQFQSAQPIDLSKRIQKPEVSVSLSQIKEDANNKVGMYLPQLETISSTTVTSPRTSERNTSMKFPNRAQIMFINKVSQIPGVSVKVVSQERFSNSTIQVFVPNILGQTARQVYAAEVETRKQFQRTELGLEIEEKESI